MEKEIERHMRHEVEKMGGKFLKWVSPGNDGVPDRIAIFPGGAVWFVELKDNGGRATALQQWWTLQLEELGCHALVIRGWDEADVWLDDRRRELGLL